MDDDLDTLVRLAEAPAPRDLSSAIRRRAAVERRRGRLWLSLTGVALALIVVGCAAAKAGHAAAAAGAGDLVAVALRDPSLVLWFPIEYGGAILAVTPWRPVLLALAAALVMMALTIHLLNATHVEGPDGASA